MTNIAWPIRCLAVFALLVLVYMAYQPGFSGALYYDDYSNLDVLESVQSASDKRQFVLGGQAGPLGRPLALLSFLPHAEKWPENSVSVLRANVLIHVCNAFLLLLLAYMLMRLATTFSTTKSFLIAIGAAALWALLPINVSTSLIAIQRMTGLAALFGLLGLTGFVAGYFFQQRSPLLAIVFQGLSLGLGTLLAIFTKESGALIPVFALVIHAVLLNKLPIQRHYRLLRAGFLWLAFLSILFYLSPFMRDWFAYDGYRGASAWSRFLSQPGILLQYLKLTFAPLPTKFSPFHDDVQFVTETWVIVAALTIWFSAVIISIATKRFSPWLLFALLWFFTGHLLESSVINLELYFEHRNYLAVFGGCLALSYFAGSAPPALSKIMPLLFVGYIGIIAVNLVATTTLWGKPMLAAETWAVSSPASARAALHLATLDIETAGGDGLQAQRSLVSFAKRSRAVSYMDKTIEACPKCIDVHMQALLYSCNIKKESEIDSRFKALLASARDGKSTLPVVDGIFPLMQLIKHKACGSLVSEDVKELLDALIANSAFSPQMYLTRLYFLRANVSYDEGKMAEAQEYLEKAERVGPQALPVLQFQVHLALRQASSVDALAAIERRRAIADDSHKMSHAVLNEIRAMVIARDNIEGIE